MTDIQPREARGMVERLLAERGYSGRVVRARTVSFEDLARGACVFVTVRDVDPADVGALDDLAHRHGFRVTVE